MNKEENIMQNFTFYSPTYFVFGKEAEAQTGAMVKQYGGTKVLIHYGGGSVVRSGLLDRVKKSLDAEGISYIELGGAKPNPLSGLVYQGIELARKEKVDFVLGVGGGSARGLGQGNRVRRTLRRRFLGLLLRQTGPGDKVPADRRCYDLGGHRFGRLHRLGHHQ